MNGKQFGGSRKVTYPLVMKLKKIEALDIYCHVTHGDNNEDLPRDIEIMLIKKFHAIYGRFPDWNKNSKMNMPVHQVRYHHLMQPTILQPTVAKL